MSEVIIVLLLIFIFVNWLNTRSLRKKYYEQQQELNHFKELRDRRNKYAREYRRRRKQLGD